jgi:hypothetical protein
MFASPLALGQRAFIIQRAFIMQAKIAHIF